MKAKIVSRRRFLQLSAGAVGATLVAACAPVAPPVQAPAEAPEAAAPAEAPAPEAVTLQFWAEGWADYVEGRIEAYKEVAPEVTIEFVTFKWGEMTPKLLTASAGGTAPDFVIQDRFRMAGYAGRGGATALDDYVAEYDVNPKDYWPATWAEGVWQGHVYSIPFETDGRFIYWNKDILEAEGLDPNAEPASHEWEAITDLAVKLTKRAEDGAIDIMGFIPSQTLGYGNGGDYVYAWSNDGEFMVDERTAWMDNPKLVETLQWQYDTIEAVGGIEDASEFSAGWPTIAGFSPFGAGKLAMMVNGDWNLSNFAKYYPDLNFGMAPWRMRGRPDESIGFAGGFCYAIPAGARQVKPAHAFMNFMSSYESQLAVGIQHQVIPCLKEAALSDELIDSSPYPELRRIANESMEYAYFRPITPVGEEIQDLWTYPGTGRDWVLYGQKTPEEACRDMQEIVQKALDDYWAQAG